MTVLTNTPCNHACWHAKEEACRCSCGGVNHGCLKTANGVIPVRTIKLDGTAHKLVMVGGDELYKHAVEDDTTRIKVATRTQIATWPELRAWRDNNRCVLLLWKSVE